MRPRLTGSTLLLSSAMPTHSRTKPASKKQIGFLRSLAAKHLPGGDDAYRAFLANSFPKKQWANPERPSTRELTSLQAHKLIERLLQIKRGAANPVADPRAELPAPTDRPSPPVPQSEDASWKGSYTATGGCTQRQVDEIARLEHQLGWQREERLRGFIERTVGTRCSPARLTKEQATQTITGLRKLAYSE